MNQTENNQDNRFCIFRCQGDVFALAASHVRSVSPHLDVTQIPVSDPAMAGLAYIQKEFVPVFELCQLMNSGDADVNSQRQMLLVSLDDCDFGLLVDQVMSLDSLEISYSTQTVGQGDWNNVLTGSATHQDDFVSVVEPRALAQMLNERLQNRWQQFEQAVATDSFESTVAASH